MPIFGIHFKAEPSIYYQNSENTLILSTRREIKLSKSHSVEMWSG